MMYKSDTPKEAYTQVSSTGFYCKRDNLDNVFCIPFHLGDMGGEIGLMLGASLLTFVEFIDLFLFLIYHQLLRLNKQKEKKEKERKESSMPQTSEKRSLIGSLFGKKESVTSKNEEATGKKQSKDFLIPKKDSSSTLIPKKESSGMLIPRKESSGTENELKKRNGKIPWGMIAKPKKDPEMGNLNVVPNSDVKLKLLPTKINKTPNPTSEEIMPSQEQEPSSPVGLLTKMNGNIFWPRKKSKPVYQPEYPELGYTEGKYKHKPKDSDDRETYI